MTNSIVDIIYLSKEPKTATYKGAIKHLEENRCQVNSYIAADYKSQALDIYKNSSFVLFTNPSEQAEVANSNAWMCFPEASYIPQDAFNTVAVQLRITFSEAPKPEPKCPSDSKIIFETELKPELADQITDKTVTALIKAGLSDHVARSHANVIANTFKNCEVAECPGVLTGCL